MRIAQTIIPSVIQDDMYILEAPQKKSKKRQRRGIEIQAALA